MRSKFSFTVNHFFPGTRLRVPAIFFILGGDICEIFASPLHYSDFRRTAIRLRPRRRGPLTPSPSNPLLHEPAQ